jgi:hypothetical protein
MGKIKVFGVVDCSEGIVGIYKSLEAIRNSARLRGENVKNMCTVGFNVNYDDDPEPGFRFYDDGQDSYLLAINRQPRQCAEDAQEIYRQLRKIIDENPIHKKGGMTLALLSEWKHKEDYVRKLIKEGK